MSGTAEKAILSQNKTQITMEDDKDFVDQENGNEHDISKADEGVEEVTKSNELGIVGIFVLAIVLVLILLAIGAVGVLGFQVSYPFLDSISDKLLASKTGSTIIVIIVLSLTVLVLSLTIVILDWVGKAVVWLVRRIFTILVGFLTVALGFGAYFFYLSQRGA
jgi:hypothetical protein